MLFYIKHEGKEYKIRVESRRHRHYVKFEDAPEERVDLVFYGYDCTFIRNNQVFFANVSGAKSEYRAWTPNGVLNFEVESEYKRLVNKLRGQDLESADRITAKMPGKILKVMVKEGALVKKGDPVMVMEAMKMENEISATKEGKVSKVHVVEGETVEAGQTLVDLEESAK